MSERIVFAATLTPGASARLTTCLPSEHKLRIRPAHDVTDEDLAWATVLCSASVPAARIRPFRNLAWLHITAASVADFLELRQSRPELRLTLTGPINAQAVAEHGLALLYALRRGLRPIIEGQAQKIWARDAVRQLQPALVRGSEAHVIGYGTVARAVIGLLAAVGMRVTVYRRTPCKADSAVAQFLPLQDLTRHVGQAGALFGILPAVPEVRNLIDRAVLAAMNRDAVLVNLGRSNLVDHAALSAALHARGIAGAALDVFDQEPLPAESPLWTTPNLLISPHVAGQFRGNAEMMVDGFLSELILPLPR